MEVQVQDGAADPHLSVAKKNALLVSHRQALIAARRHFIFTKTAVSEDYSVAFDVLGGTANDELLTGDEKKRLEDVRRKRKQDSNWAGMAGGRRGGNLLPMAFGAKKYKRDKSNSPCFECK